MIHSRNHYIGMICVLGGFFFMMGPMALVIQLITGDTIDGAGNRWDDRTIMSKLFFAFSAWASLILICSVAYAVWQEKLIPFMKGELKSKRQLRKEAAVRETLARMNINIPEHVLLMVHTKGCYKRKTNHFNTSEFDGCDCVCHESIKD